MSDPEPSVSKTPFPTALIAGAGIGICGGMAVLFMSTLSIFMLPIIGDLGWSRSQVALLTTSAFVGYALGSPVLGYLFDRFGARVILMAGVANQVVMLTLLGTLSLTPGVAALIAFEIGFVGAATAPSGYGLIVALSTNKRLGLILGLAMLGYGFGVTFMPIAIEQLIARLGWRNAYVAMAAIAGILGGTAVALGVGRNVVGKAARAANAAEYAGIPFLTALRDYRFWIVFCTATMLALSGFGVTAHLAAIAADRGLTASEAASTVAIFGLGLFVGRVGAAILMDRIFAPFVAISMSLLGGSGLLTLNFVTGDDASLIFVAAFLMGLLTGSEGDTIPFMTRRYFGKHSFGTIFGFMVGAMGIGGIIGPLAFGWTFDTQASYAPILQVTTALCAVSAFLFLFMGPYRYPEDR